MNIHIVGGSGQMGQWLKKYFENHSLIVTVSGRNNKNIEGIKKADIVFISVPLAAASKMIEETSQIMHKDQLLVDLSSLQMHSYETLKKTSLSSAVMHLLFGPTISSLHNQKISLYKIKSSKKLDQLVDIFKKDGAHILEMDPQTHDFKMAHIQALTHFANISLARVFLDDGIDLSGAIATPVFLAQASAISRVISQPSELLSLIQTENPIYKETLLHYLNYEQKLSKMIIDDDVDKLKTEIESIHKNLESSKNKDQKKDEKNLIHLNIEKGKIGFLGPKGTFSHQAALSLAKKEDQLVVCNTILEIFQAVSNGSVEYGLVPAENSIEGSIRETLDYLIDFEMKVNGSLDLSVHQNLLSKEKSLKSIKRVISHPQAIAQSRNWLTENLPNAKIETSSSTVAAVPETKKDGVGIIAAEVAAKMYGLNIVAKKIESNKENTTRFYVISKHEGFVDKKPRKTLLFLTVFNRVGVLRDILNIFADNGINLTKLESRPSREKNWDYHFFIEVEATQKDEKLVQALNILKQLCPVIKVIGEI